MLLRIRHDPLLLVVIGLLTVDARVALPGAGPRKIVQKKHSSCSIMWAVNRICTPWLQYCVTSAVFNVGTIPWLEPHDDLGRVALYTRCTTATSSVNHEAD